MPSTGVPSGSPSEPAITESKASSISMWSTSGGRSTNLIGRSRTRTSSRSARFGRSRSTNVPSAAVLRFSRLGDRTSLPCPLASTMSIDMSASSLTSRPEMLSETYPFELASRSYRPVSRPPMRNTPRRLVLHFGHTNCGMLTRRPSASASAVFASSSETTIQSCKLALHYCLGRDNPDIHSLNYAEPYATQPFRAGYAPLQHRRIVPPRTIRTTERQQDQRDCDETSNRTNLVHALLTVADSTTRSASDVPPRRVPLEFPPGSRKSEQRKPPR